jgi:hypothetical protein
MPFRSLKQARWAHSQTGEKALGGPAKVSEWDSAHAMLHIPPDQKLTAAQETPKPGDSPLLRRRKASAKGFSAMKH